MKRFGVAMADDLIQPQQGEPVEADERFPSGKWLGFWLQQDRAGRQWMRDLWLRFFDGRITGGGSDWIGAFTLSGRYDVKTGKCTLFKDYLGAHRVIYDGQNEGDGMWLWGLWKIVPFDRGGFHLWPHGEDDPTMRRAKAEKDVPVAEPEPAPAA